MKKLCVQKINLKCMHSSLSKKKFSIIHNYHSPYILWLGVKYEMMDDNIEEYNRYIQAFLTKRFTHKKEIAPKIKVLKDLQNVLKDYHNTFYIQKTFPLYNLLNLTYMKYMHSHKIFDTGYVISRFSEEYEKNMYDAVFEKLLVCGRVEFMEDKPYFDEIRSKIDSLVSTFYNGDKLSPFEREIERTYLILKQNKLNEIISKQRMNPKSKKSECFLTFSERNKLSGHVNFRMMHPTYFFQSRPIFETIDVEKMFYSLYEMRYNTLKFYQVYSKLKLKFQYRKALLQNMHRVEFLSHYIYLQIYQYLESYEFNNEFNLSLNFRISFNMIVFHLWLVIQRLQQLINEKDKNEKFCLYLTELLENKIVDYFAQNIDNFQLSQTEIPQIADIKKFIRQNFDLFTWHFNVVGTNNPLENLRNLFREAIFLETIPVGDYYLSKFCYYAFIHYEYINTKSYKDIEHCNFNFSALRIPYTFNTYILNNDHLSSKFKNYNIYSKIKNQTTIEEYYKNYKASENLFLDKPDKLKNTKLPDIFYELVNIYGINPYKKRKNFMLVDVSKGISGKIETFLKMDLNPSKALELEEMRYEEEMTKPKNIGTIWESKTTDESDIDLDFSKKIQEKRKLYLKQMEQQNKTQS